MSPGNHKFDNPHVYPANTVFYSPLFVLFFAFPSVCLNKFRVFFVLSFMSVYVYICLYVSLSFYFAIASVLIFVCLYFFSFPERDVVSRAGAQSEKEQRAEAGAAAFAPRERRQYL